MAALEWALWIGVVLAGLMAAAVVFTRRRRDWGATAEERAAAMPGDAYLEGGPPVRVAMTRAVSIDAPPETLWPWLAQLGRGAGWYSVDRLDNGGVESARHLVSWVPPPALGDASAIGYLREVTSGSALTWWTPGVGFLGAHARLVTDISLRGVGAGSRLVIRMSADASGAAARPALWVFKFIDGIMAVRQLRGLRERTEQHGARTADPARPETGARDQFQRYEVIYASGERAGVRGKEDAPRWRRAAQEAGRIGRGGASSG